MDLVACELAEIEAPSRPRQRQRRLAEHEVDVLGQAYQDGQTVPDLVEAFGIHRTTVLAHLERRGIERRANKRKLTDEQADEAAQCHQAGESINAIGRRLGVSERTVAKELARTSNQHGLA